jgi:hypothetical protein
VADVQKLRREHEKKVGPMHQQLQAKRAELDAIYYATGAVDVPKVQKLYKEIADIKAELFVERASLKRKLAEKGVYGGMRQGCRGGGRGHGW